MRAIWRGAVSFGLVNVPVRVYAATAAREVRFHQVHAADGGRIHLKRVCSVDGEEVPSAEISKGYDTGDGLVVLSEDDLASLPLASGREIEVVEFVPIEQIDPVLYDRTYYLEPDATAAKPYALLREALARTERVAVVTVALRQRESLALLRVRGDVICLQTLLWPEEVRAPDLELNPASASSLKPREVEMAAQLVQTLASDFEPSAFTDRYAQAVKELVEGKIERGDVTRPAAASSGGGDGGGEVLDLLAALQRSVERAGAATKGAPAKGEPAGTGSAAPAATRRSSSRTRKAAAAEPETAEPAAPAAKTTTRRPRAASKTTATTASKTTATASRKTSATASEPKVAAKGA